MTNPKLQRGDLSTCKSCLDHIDRAKGNLAYAQLLGRDVSEPLNQLDAMRNGVLGVLSLAKESEATIQVHDDPFSQR